MTGAFDGNEVIEILLERPRTAEHITEKIWREFVDDQPPPDTVASLAEAFRRQCDYDIATLLHAYSHQSASSTIRTTGGIRSNPPGRAAGRHNSNLWTCQSAKAAFWRGRDAGLGQDIFDPPNVKGWAGGEQWITSDSLDESKTHARTVSSWRATTWRTWAGAFWRSWVDNLDEDLRTARGVQIHSAGAHHRTSPPIIHEPGHRRSRRPAKPRLSAQVRLIMKRRHFLNLAAGATFCRVSHPPIVAAPAPRWDRILVLVELNGGNDGLNTVVPYSNRTYYRLRPTLAVPRDNVLALSEQAGLNPALQPLMSAWEERDLAIVQGVGYPDPNRSHFRSIEIWDTGSAPKEYLSSGWIARALTQVPLPADLAADALVLGRGNLGALSGAGLTNIVMRRPEQMSGTGTTRNTPRTSSTNPALSHVLKVEQDLENALASFSQYRGASPEWRMPFSNNRLSRQLENASRGHCRRYQSAGDKGVTQWLRHPQQPAWPA